ncbi:MAG: ABC transporter permease [Treponema sp.]|jgi:simple sugar transport system permease protein|nr:ABC transporter permease [Treponema sp.]
MIGVYAAAVAFLSASLRMAIPLTLAGLGETISERSGIINIGVEAIMLSGAFFSFLTVFATGNMALGLAAGIAGGAAISVIHGLLSLKCRADQTIAGLALNFLVLGLTNFLFLRSFGRTTTLPSIAVVKPISVPLLSRLPLVGPVLFELDVFGYLCLGAVILLCVLFYKTEWGVSLHAVGEHPRAADTAGLRVERIRLMAALANGVLGGLGGAYLTMAKLGFFIENISAGKGYIALVTVILGRRNPVGVFLAALIIGAAEALQFRLQTSGVNIPSQVFTSFPYLMTVIALLFSIGRSRDPAALGVPYERDR